MLIAIAKTSLQWRFSVSKSFGFTIGKRWSIFAIKKNTAFYARNLLISLNNWDMYKNLFLLMLNFKLLVINASSPSGYKD